MSKMTDAKCDRERIIAKIYSDEEERIPGILCTGDCVGAGTIFVSDIGSYSVKRKMQEG